VSDKKNFKAGEYIRVNNKFITETWFWCILNFIKKGIKKFAKRLRKIWTSGYFFTAIL
jgi:hypothetical protein